MGGIELVRGRRPHGARVARVAPGDVPGTGQDAPPRLRMGRAAGEGSSTFGYARQSLVTESEIRPPVTDASIADRPTIGLGPLRPAPAGMPDPAITPPTVAEAG